MRAALNRLTPVQVFLLASAGLLPLAHSLLFLRSQRTPRLALLVLSIGVLAGAAIVGSPSWIRRESKLTQISIASGALFLVWMSLSAAVGLDPVRSLMGHNFQGTGLIFFAGVYALYVASVRHRDGLRGPLGSVLLAVGAFFLLMVCIGFVLSATGKMLASYSLVSLSAEGVPLPGLANSTLLAFFVCIIVALALGRAVAGRRGSWTLGIFAVALEAFIVVTQARAAIGLSLVTVATILLLSRRKASWVKLTFFGTLFVVAVVVAQLLLVPNLPQRQTLLQMTVEGGSAPEGPGQASGRFEASQVQEGLNFRRTVWGVGLRIIASEPIFGVGPSNFSYPYRSALRHSEAARMAAPGQEVQDAHNILIETAATSGIPGLLLLLGWWIPAIAGLLRASDVSSTPIKLAVLVVAAGHLLEPLSLVLTPLMLMLAGAGLGQREPDQIPAAEPETTETPAAEPETPERTVAPIWRRAAAGVPVAAALGLAVTMLVSDFLLARGSLNWDREELALASRLDPTCNYCLYDLGKVRSWDHAKEGAGTQEWSLEPYRSAVRKHPLDSFAHLRLGVGLMYLKKRDEAIGALQEAVRLEPYSPVNAYSLAIALAGSGRIDEAVPYAKLVADFDPSPGAFNLLADAAAASGDASLAAYARAEADRLSTRSRE